MNSKLRSSKGKEYYVFRIYSRPWYEWGSWGIWILLEIFLLQNALACGYENEVRAGLIFWLLFVIVLLGGIIVYFSRHVNRQSQESHNTHKAEKP